MTRPPERRRPAVGATVPARPRAGATGPPFVVDVEASGFGPSGYPIEVGVAMDEGRRASRLIRPAAGWTHWDAGAERVHGIARDTLLARGGSVAEVAGALNGWLAGRTVYSDAWVVDRPWLAMLFRAAGLPMAFSVSPVEALLSEARLAIWDAVKREVIAELGATRHRASQDAWVVQETLVRVRRRAG